MSFQSKVAGLVLSTALFGVGIVNPSRADPDCDSMWEPYVEIEGSTSETVAGARGIRGAPRAILCDRALEMSGSVICASPWFGIDPDASLSWRGTGMILEGEFVFGNLIARSFRGGSFEVVDESDPGSPILSGQLKSAILIWSMITLSGGITVYLDVTGGSAPQHPNLDDLTLAADLIHDGDATGWEAHVDGAIQIFYADPRAAAPTSWGQIKALYR